MDSARIRERQPIGLGLRLRLGIKFRNSLCESSRLVYLGNFIDIDLFMRILHHSSHDERVPTVTTA